MKRLLILSCGTNACFHIAKILKQKFVKVFYIIGCDINKQWLIPTCDYLDEFYQSPFSSEENYYSFVIDICKKENVDFLLPSFDNDQFLFSCDNQDLKKLGVTSLAISSALNFYRSKKCTNDYLKSIGIPIPKRYSKEAIDDDTEYFVKPVHGVGSIGIYKEKGCVIKKSTEIDNNDYIIQEICSEPEYTLECFLYKHKIYSVVRERIASKAGVCTKTRIFQDKNLDKFAYKLAEDTELPHIFNMQFMKNQNGEYVCTDLNLRTAGGMSLSYAAGWDEVSALAKIMIGKDEGEILSTVDVNIDEQYILRYYEDSITKIIKKRIAFDLDGTLLDFKKRHEIVMSDVLEKYGINLDTVGLVDFKAEGKNNIDWLLENGIDKGVADRINRDWISKIENFEYLKSDVLYPESIDVLKCLCRKNELFLITARKNNENSIAQIKKLGIAQYFSAITVVDSCKETPVLKSAELQKYKVDCFIGDTESDYKAAELAGCDFKSVSYGFRSENYWKNKEANVIKSIKNFSKYLDK